MYSERRRGGRQVTPARNCAYRSFPTIGCPNVVSSVFHPMETKSAAARVATAPPPWLPTITTVWKRSLAICSRHG